MTGVQTCALPICFPVTINGVDKGRVAESGTVYATTSKNLHELGSKQDIQGFKDLFKVSNSKN